MNCCARRGSERCSAWHTHGLLYSCGARPRLRVRRRGLAAASLREPGDDGRITCSRLTCGSSCTYSARFIDHRTFPGALSSRCASCAGRQRLAPSVPQARRRQGGAAGARSRDGVPVLRSQRPGVGGGGPCGQCGASDGAGSARLGGRGVKRLRGGVITATKQEARHG
jgi:hypothetical protein